MLRRNFIQAAVATASLPFASLQAAASATPQGFDIVRAHDRGLADHGWLLSRHTFSFADYYNPAQMGFSDLLVINEDKVAPGRGFGMHPHRDMEIFSYVLSGELEHRDSMRNGEVIRPGDVQLMSAGVGVRHSEFNPQASEGVHFLQIWLLPSTPGGAPTYQQRTFTEAEKRGKLALIISGADTADGRALSIKQDARVYAGLFDGKERASLTLGADRHAYVHVARGTITLNGLELQAGDGVKVRAPGQKLTLSHGKGAEVLLFDLRQNGATGA
ncbi:pirin family protein [Burkholderia ubonensis]|uniref:pirin family protein n=1 Tax=Burkholderia ubonensis TaxID=101571 RepID=UPI0009B46BB6|nr:pirin family protein [Burkholderia ubonensis]